MQFEKRVAYKQNSLVILFHCFQKKPYQADFLCISLTHVERSHNCWKKFLVFQDPILVGIQLIENRFKFLSFVARHFVVSGDFDFVTCMELKFLQLRVCVRCALFRVYNWNREKTKRRGNLVRCRCSGIPFLA